MENILKNEALMNKLADVDSAQALTAILAEHGITLDDGVSAQDFLNILKNPCADSEELDEGALGAVSGGSVLGSMILARLLAEEIARRMRNHGGGGHRF